MYKIEIDYSGYHDGPHWYGGNEPPMPAIPNSEKRFYCLFNLDAALLPVEIGLSGVDGRLYLPHYLFSDLIIEDLFFLLVEDGVELLNDFGETRVPIYDDDICLEKFGLRFVPLAPMHNPASAEFDEEAYESPHHQLGGRPLFRQPGGHALTCCKCEGPMKFLLQFDNDRSLNAFFGDDGSLYFWFCSTCGVIGARVEE